MEVMRLLVFGDVFGKLGREGVKQILPKWKKKFSPDVVIANIENIAHGKGIGIKQINELGEAGVDVFTGGNHSLEGKDFAQILNDETLPILRPANIANAPGRGALLYKFKNKNIKSKINEEVSLLVVNLIGQVFMRGEYENPFHAADKILEEYGDDATYKILDWHADATSEKVVMGWYLDGRVSAVFGTHSHVPTADARILPRGTAYISDIGMVGPHHSVIGVEIEPSFRRFRDGAKTEKNPVELGPIEINAILLKLQDRAEFGINPVKPGRAVDIRHLREIIY